MTTTLPCQKSHPCRWEAVTRLLQARAIKSQLGTKAEESYPLIHEQLASFQP